MGIFSDIEYWKDLAVERGTEIEALRKELADNERSYSEEIRYQSELKIQAQKELTAEREKVRVLREAAQTVMDKESCGEPMIKSEWSSHYWNLYQALKQTGE